MNMSARNSREFSPEEISQLILGENSWRSSWSNLPPYVKDPPVSAVAASSAGVGALGGLVEATSPRPLQRQVSFGHSSLPLNSVAGLPMQAANHVQSSAIPIQNNRYRRRSSANPFMNRTTLFMNGTAASYSADSPFTENELRQAFSLEPVSTSIPSRRNSIASMSEIRPNLAAGSLDERLMYDYLQRGSNSTQDLGNRAVTQAEVEGILTELPPIFQASGRPKITEKMDQIRKGNSAISTNFIALQSSMANGILKEDSTAARAQAKKSTESLNELNDQISAMRREFNEIKDQTQNPEDKKKINAVSNWLDAVQGELIEHRKNIIEAQQDIEKGDLEVAKRKLKHSEKIMEFINFQLSLLFKMLHRAGDMIVNAAG